MQTALIAPRNHFGKMAYALALAFVMAACVTVKPVDSTIVTSLAQLKTQIPNLYTQFLQDPMPTQAIDDVRTQLTIIKSRSDAREGKDSRFSDAVATIQATFESHVALRQKAVWKQVDVDDYGKSITNMIQIALDVENQRPAN